MRRHPSLRPLSREHHAALVEARRLLTAGDAPARRLALASFSALFRTLLEIHFELEEAWLPRLLPGAAGELEQLARDHADLRELAAWAERQAGAAEPAAELVRGLGQKLQAHVRWEERRLFPLLEAEAPAAVLAAFGRRLAELEVGPARSCSPGAARLR